jgi:aspartyl/asparaginyl beta-hydroxylase (cupin superfamily)
MTVRATDARAAAEALHERARGLLANGNHTGALAALNEAVGLDPGHLPYLLSLAAVLRTLGRRQEELAILERALELDPTHLVVLLQKASVLELMNKPRSAAAIYTHALQSVPNGAQLPGPIQAHLAHARKRVAANAEQVAALIDERIAALPRAAASVAERQRFDRCLDRVLGRQRIFTPDPTFMLFPYLMNYEFFPREFSPWLDALEAATQSIRDEFQAAYEGDSVGIEPYIAYKPGLPLNQWKELNHSPRWGAYFLWNQGQRQESHLTRCPRTAAVLESLPQVDVPGRGPTAFFSLLAPRTTIPPHTGVTNTRLTVHLPLIVPPGCRFRVGGETREWQSGTAWVFDDTIEHEAWNDSDAPRAILIFDVWNPQLTPLERDLVRAATAVLAEYSDAEERSAGAAT